MVWGLNLKYANVEAILLPKGCVMANTDEILEQAQSLGKMIAGHKSVKKLEQMINQLQGDTEAQRVLNDFNRHLQTLEEKQSKGQPIEVEDKHKLEAAQLAVATNPVLRDFQMMQMDYVDLMRQVDVAIRGQGAGVDAADIGGAEATIPTTNPDLSGR